MQSASKYKPILNIHFAVHDKCQILFPSTAAQPSQFNCTCGCWLHCAFAEAQQDILALGEEVDKRGGNKGGKLCSELDSRRQEGEQNLKGFCSVCSGSSCYSSCCVLCSNLAGLVSLRLLLVPHSRPATQDTFVGMGLSPMAKPEGGGADSTHLAHPSPHRYTIRLHLAGSLQPGCAGLPLLCKRLLGVGTYQYPL